MSQSLEEQLGIDVEALKSVIEEAQSLNDNQEVFEQLAQISKHKKSITDILEQLERIEREAKSLIKNKADTLYGKEWTSIKGEGYKINKSFTGAVFGVQPDVKPPKKFVKVKESLDTKLIEEHIKETGKLPKGIEYNQARATSIRIYIND